MTYHVPVLLKESVDGLAIKPDGVYVDVTFGAGGHSKSILSQLGVKGHLYAFDQDEDAFRNALDDPRFTLVRSNFKYVKNFLRLYGVTEVDGILADLGVSSFQIDEAARGFTYREDGPLDMRMNQYMKMSAADLLNSYTRDDLVYVLSNYGEVRNSKSLAQRIVERRSKVSFRTISDLTELLDEIYMGSKHKYFAQVFQAIRIEVNDEIGVLKKMLQQCPSLLKEGGRLSVISYHSLEDRLVKRLMKTGNVEGVLEKDDFGKSKNNLRIINKKIILPSDKELGLNSRARSAKLRIAEKM